jgi:hypothetical protein
MISIAKPKLSTCWYCEKPQSAAAWHGHRAVCARCDAFMAQGVICIGVHTPIAGETIVDKVYRDGNWCVLSCSEYTKRIGAVPVERHAFVDKAKWQRSGLPKFGKHGASHEYDGEYGAVA